MSDRWPRAAVFDFDGLLVDTGRCWADAYSRTLTRHGRSLSRAALAQLAGASVSQAAHHLDVPEGELRRDLARAFRSHPLQLMPGASGLITKLREGSALAIATNAPAKLVESTLERLAIRDLFALVASAESPTNREKPAPDVFAEACTHLRVRPADAVAFEDSPIGVAAARSAGLTVVYVPSDGQKCDGHDLQVAHLGDPKLLAFLETT